MNETEVNSMVNNLLKSLNLLNPGQNAANTHVYFSKQGHHNSTNDSDDDSDSDFDTTDSDDSDNDSNSNDNGNISSEQLNQIFANFGNNLSGQNNANPFGPSFANAFAGPNFNGKSPGKQTYTVNTFVNGKKIGSTSKTYDSDGEEVNTQPKTTKKLELNNEKNVKKTKTKPKSNEPDNDVDEKVDPAKDKKLNQTKSKKTSKNETNQIIMEPDMTEVEFDEKLANFLGGQTNPQLKFICGQVMMSRSTYKNKAEYIKMITQYVKSRNDEQIKSICKENQVPNNLPRFKQLVCILEKKLN
jgi:hypothetical protein